MFTDTLYLAVRKALLSATAALLVTVPFAATADELIRYTFEDLASPLSEGGAVGNTAPDAISDIATLVNAANMDVSTGGRVSFDGNRYDLGTSLNIITKSGHVNTGELLSALNIRANTDYTAMAWMNVLDQSGDHMIFATNQAGRELHLGTRNGFYHSGHWGDDLQHNTAPIAMPATQPGTWHHVTYQNRTDGTQLFYLNGVLSGQGATQADGTKPDDSNLVIGDCRDARDYQGLVDEVKVFNTLLTEAEIRAAAIEGLPIVQEPNLSGASFVSVSETTFELTDFDDGMAQSTIDDSTVVLLRDGVAVTANTSKIGGVTTITHEFEAGLPIVLTDYVFTIQADLVEGGTFEQSVTLRSNALPAEIRPGLDAPPNATTGWDVIEIATADFPAPLVAISTGEQSHRDMVEVIRNGVITVQGPAPYINHSDPDLPGGPGDWCPDLPILSDQAGTDENNFVTYARTILTIGNGEEGDYTIRIRGDDGYALRITGATFTAAGGAGPNMVDPNDPSTALHPLETGNSNAFLNVNFPAPGDYPVEFLANEIGGGAYQEISWAPGTFTALNQTFAWRLIGDDSGFVGESCWGEIPASLIPPIGAEGWSTHIWYGLGQQIGSLQAALNFIRGLDGGGSTFTDEFIGELATLNHSDNAVNAGRINPTEAIPGDPDLAGDTNDFVLISHARIVSPADGEYSLQFRCDDGFLFRFLDPSVQFTSSSGAGTLHPTAFNEVFFAANTGDTNTRATVFLPEGEYDAVFVWWERAGGAHFEVSTAAGDHPAQEGPYTLLTTTGIPAGPEIVGIGTTAAGWEVTSTAPGAGDIVAGNGNQFEVIVNGLLDDAAMTPANVTMQPEINFTDPESNAGGAGLRNTLPWPNDTPANDDDYAMRGTAMLDMPADGTVALGFQGDDGTYLDVIGQPWDSVAETAVGAFLAERDPIGNPGVLDRLIFDGGTGNSRSVGLINLTAGQHPIEFGFYEDGGGSYITIMGATGDSYVNGAQLIPVGATTAGEMSQTPAGLFLGRSLPPRFEITDFEFDDIAEELTVTFNSEDGVEYGVDFSSTAAVGSWGEATDANGTGDSTTVVILYSSIKSALGLLPADPLPDTVLCRVRDTR